MGTLKWKLEQIGNDMGYYHAFRELFGEGTDSAGLATFVQFLKEASIFLSLFILFILIISFQTCNLCKQKYFLRFILSIIFLILCFGINCINVYYAFSAKYKVDFPDEYIYIFDEGFNNEIKDHLDYMFRRKIYLILLVVFIQIFFICQIVAIILKERIIKKENTFDDKNKYFEKNFEIDNLKDIESS